MKDLRKILSLFFLLTCTIACEDIDCSLNNTVKLTTGFYANGKQVAINDTLTVTTTGSDSILLNHYYNVSKMELPMSFWNTTDTLILMVKGMDYTTQDSVWISKTNTPHFESPDCPSHMFHNITGVSCTHNFIDSITIIHPNVNYAEIENLQIHLFADN